MARFTLTRLDELGIAYPEWESDDMDEANDQLDHLHRSLDDARQPQSGQLEEMIRDLKGQIDEAEAEESEATMQAIADLVFPPAPWQKA